MKLEQKSTRIKPKQITKTFIICNIRKNKIKGEDMYLYTYDIVMKWLGLNFVISSKNKTSALDISGFLHFVGADIRDACIDGFKQKKKRK